MSKRQMMVRCALAAMLATSSGCLTALAAAPSHRPTTRGIFFVVGGALLETVAIVGVSELFRTGHVSTTRAIVGGSLTVVYVDIMAAFRVAR